MSQGQDEYDYGAYCGLYCGACALLLANERGTVVGAHSCAPLPRAPLPCAPLL
jgi:hypothetical protein